MPGPYPLELDVTIWQAPDTTLSRVECDEPQLWHGETSMTCHVFFSIDPTLLPEAPIVASLGVGMIVLAALARRGGRRCAGQ